MVYLLHVITIIMVHVQLKFRGKAQSISLRSCDVFDQNWLLTVENRFLFFLEGQEAGIFFAKA